MFAVIKTGGKQYHVSPDDVIKVDYKSDAKAGETLELADVLAIGNGDDITIGKPTLDGARVIASVLEQTRGKKVTIFKKKRRKNHRKTQGHRQDLTVLKIEEILKAGQKPSPKRNKNVSKEPSGESVSVDNETARVAKKAPAKKTPAKKEPAKKTPAKKEPAKKTPAKKAPAKKTPAKKEPAKKTPAKKTPAKKAPAKKAPAKKAPDKKAPAKKAPDKKAPAKKAPAKKAPAKKAPAKK